MAKIVRPVKKESESRQHQRFTVPKGTFVIVSPGTDKEWKVQAIDISQGGMAFIYCGYKEDLEMSGALKILAKNTNLRNIAFETVSDIPAPVRGCKDTSLPSRRRGVKFKWMGVMGASDFKDFIKSINI
jgi:hypothetical protein